MNVITMLIGALMIVGLLIFTAVNYINKKVNSVMEAASQKMNDNVQVITKGLNYYKKESELWYSRYIEDVNKRVAIEEELVYIRKEVKTLRYIVDKLDGRIIYRDDHNDTDIIRRVK